MNRRVCPLLWYRYVDDRFTMFEFLRYLNSRHNSIKFIIGFEQDSEIPFLDILVKRCPDKTFVTSIYRKKTFTGLYTKWDLFTPRKYKMYRTDKGKKQNKTKHKGKAGFQNFKSY